MRYHFAICKQCGMEVMNDEFHPYGACLMFMATKDASVVRANLEFIVFAGKEIKASERAPIRYLRAAKWMIEAAA